MLRATLHRNWRRWRVDEPLYLCELDDAHHLSPGIHYWRCSSSLTSVYVELNNGWLFAGYVQNEVTVVTALWSLQNAQRELIDVRGEKVSLLNPTLSLGEVEERIWTILRTRAGDTTMVKIAPHTAGTSGWRKLGRMFRN